MSMNEAKEEDTRNVQDEEEASKQAKEQGKESERIIVQGGE